MKVNETCILILLILIFVTGSRCQESKVAIGNKGGDSSEAVGSGLGSPLCEEFRLLAVNKLKKDSLYIPSLNYQFSRTAFKILENEYGLIERDFINGDVIPSEVICFDEVMTNVVQHKYGRHFFDSILVSSDSLEKAGTGYIESALINYSSLEQCFRENFRYKDSLVKNDNLMLVISFDITQSGRLDNPIFYQGYLSSGEVIEIRDEKYKNEIARVLNISGPWMPAKLKNTPIKDKKVIVVDRLTFR